MTKIFLYGLFTGMIFCGTFCSKADKPATQRPSDDPDNFDTSIALPQLTVFAAPAGAPGNNTFSVYVRYEGGEWVDLHEYDAEVDGGYLPSPVYHMAFVSFDADFSKKIEVKVRKNDGAMSGVKIRPAIAGIVPTVVDNNTITFTLTTAVKLSVETNGDLHNNLMVFANKVEENPITGGGSNVHYFGPGIHKLGGDGKGLLVLNSNDKVYIAGGAVVYGSLYAAGKSNISITGRGILSGGMYTDHAYPHSLGRRLIVMDNSDNINIEGITLLNSVTWNIHLNFCSDVVCKNLKIMGWTINSDGINPVSSDNVLIDDCFIRNYDDCISIKMGYAGASSPSGRDSRNITVQNTMLWTDQGRAIGFGPESYSTEEKVMDSMTIKNIDVLYNKNYDVDWAKGVISILLGDDVTLQNVTFEDIRVDKIGSNTNLVHLAILQTELYNLTPGKRIQNIQFNRVSLNPGTNIPNVINGYDPNRIVSGVSFTDLKINNTYIKDAQSGNFKINPYAQGITFNAPE